MRKQTHFIKSLGKGISILQAFSAERQLLTLTEIAGLTGMNTSAAQRFTDTWMALGFLKRNRHKEFFLAPKVLSLGFSFLNGSQLRRLAEAHLTEFAERINRNVNLGVLDDGNVVYLFRKETQSFIKLDLWTGSIMPSYCTAMGKVLLAGLDDQKLKEVLDKMELVRVTKHTITNRDELWADLMKTRKRGYSVCDRELTLALYSLAAPVLDSKGTVVAAVNISMSADEAMGVHLQEMVAELINVGQELSASMDYSGDYPVISPDAYLTE